MAHSKSALKRWRQNEAHRERNKPVRTGARSSVRKAQSAIDGGGDDAKAAISEAASILDRAAKRRVIHPNAASRHKSRLMKHLNQATASPGASEAAPKRARKATTGRTAAKGRSTATRSRTTKPKA